MLRLNHLLDPHANVDGGQLRLLPIEALQRGCYQPRQQFDAQALSELADSIRLHGVVQPIVVRPCANGRYEILAGERRWRAAQQAGLYQVPVLVREVDDQAALALALIENIQREDLNPLEEAQALARLIDEFQLTHQQAAQAVGRSRAAVSNLLRLLELVPEVQQALLQGQLDMGHARALLALPSAQQLPIARRVWSEKLSVRATEHLIRRLHSERQTLQQRTSADLLHLQQCLSECLGAAVTLKVRRSGGGQVQIDYHDLEQLEGILSRINGFSYGFD